VHVLNNVAVAGAIDDEEQRELAVSFLGVALGGDGRQLAQVWFATDDASEAVVGNAGANVVMWRWLALFRPVQPSKNSMEAQ
jgi:hypothetical protein